MDFYRLWHTIRLCTIRSAVGRANYIKKNNIFYHMGKNCSYQNLKMPLYPKLISWGNNVWAASNVSLITHDVTHHMLNHKYEAENKSERFKEYAGCIEIGDNVFIGANSTILPNVKIGSNTIIGANALILSNTVLPSGSVWGGVPVKRLGSFEDFVEKKKQQTVSVKRSSGEELNQEMVEVLWKHFTEIFDNEKQEQLDVKKIGMESEGWK